MQPYSFLVVDGLGNLVYETGYPGDFAYTPTSNGIAKKKIKGPNGRLFLEKADLHGKTYREAFSEFVFGVIFEIINENKEPCDLWQSCWRRQFLDFVKTQTDGQTFITDPKIAKWILKHAPEARVIDLDPPDGISNMVLHTREPEFTGVACLENMGRGSSKAFSAFMLEKSIKVFIVAGNFDQEEDDEAWEGS